jgi:hypothetical protein
MVRGIGEIMDRDFTIGFSTSKSFISAMLRWLMSSSISHVYGSWKIHKDVRMVVGMESNGLDWRPLRKFNKTNELKYVFKPAAGKLADPAILEAMLNDFSNEYANKEYAFNVIGLLFIYSVLNKLGSIGRWVRKKIHGSISYLSLRFFGDDKEVCCSAYIELLQKAEYSCVSHLKSHENDTQELLTALMGSDQWNLVYDSGASE